MEVISADDTERDELSFELTRLVARRVLLVRFGKCNIVLSFPSRLPTHDAFNVNNIPYQYCVAQPD
jgi:hypothetical protein